MEPRFTSMSPEPATADPDPAQRAARALDDSDRFHRDTSLGRIFHPGKASFREIAPTDSLHIVIEGSRLSVHVDRISPLKCRDDGSIGYSLTRVVAHNVAGVGCDVVRLVRRRHPHRRATLELKLAPSDENAFEPSDVAHLVDHCRSQLNLPAGRTRSTELAS